MRFDPRPLPDEFVAETNRREIALSLLVPLCFLAVCCFLPYNKYVLYQELDGNASRARKIYDRILFASNPLDVVFLGTSHTMVAVDPERVEQDLAEKGIRASTGNLAMHWHGRDSQYVVLKELLARHTPRLVLIEVREVESRISHTLFPFLADSTDLLSAPIFLNRSYHTNVAGLPGRNLKAFFKSINPETFGMKPEPEYGPDYDRYNFEPHEKSLTKEEMEEKRREHVRIKRWRYLPIWLDWLEFRFPRLYRERMVDMLEASGAKVAFLYLPFFGADGRMTDREFYLKRGPVLIPPNAILDNPSHWFDATHLNLKGAEELTAWLGEQLPGLLKEM